MLLIGLPKLRFQKISALKNKSTYNKNEIKLGEKTEIVVPFKSDIEIQLVDLDNGKDYGAAIKCAQEIGDYEWRISNNFPLKSESYIVATNSTKKVKIILSKSGDLYYTPLSVEVSPEKWQSRSQKYFYCGIYEDILISDTNKLIKIPKSIFKSPLNIKITGKVNKRKLEITPKETGNYQLRVVPKLKYEKAIITELSVTGEQRYGVLGITAVSSSSPVSSPNPSQSVIPSPAQSVVPSPVASVTATPRASLQPTPSNTPNPSSSPRLSVSPSPVITIVPSPSMSASPSPSPSVNPCGNYILDAGEECDDGNSSTGDGCDDKCKCSVDLIDTKLVIEDGSRDNVYVETNNQSKITAASVGTARVINTPEKNIQKKGLLELELDKTKSSDIKIALKVKQARWYGYQERECFYHGQQSLYEFPVTATFANGCKVTKPIKAMVTFGQSQDGAVIKFTASGEKWTRVPKTTATNYQCCVTMSGLNYGKTCTPRVGMKETHSYYGYVMKEESRHCDQNLKNLPWSVGGYPTLTASSLIKMITGKKTSSYKACLTLPIKDNTAEGTCDKVQKSMEEKIRAEIKKVNAIEKKLHTEGTPEFCWREKTAKNYIKMTKDKSGIYYECAYPSCKNIQSQPADPYKNYR